MLIVHLLGGRNLINEYLTKKTAYKKLTSKKIFKKI